MSLTTIGLGSFKLRSRESKLKLTVSTTCVLSLPADLAENPCAEELAGLVKVGRLWIARAGKCQLGMQLTTNGQGLGLNGADLTGILEEVGNYEVSVS